MMLTLAGARSMGEPVKCHLAENLQTTIFELPTLRLNGELEAPAIIQDFSDIRAILVTNPIEYLIKDDFSEQKDLQADFLPSLFEACQKEGDESQKSIFLIVQLKEALGPFPAVDGQCIQINDAGIARVFIANCGEQFLPPDDGRSRRIDSLRTAIKTGFNLTGGIEPIFDKQCYKTEEGKAVFPLNIRGKATLTVSRPMTFEDFQTKTKSCANLAKQLESCIEQNRIPGGPGTRADFGATLEELMEALQLEPSDPDAYHRIWFLRLWNRTEKFGRSFNPRLDISNDATLKPVKEHRNTVAHRGVDRLDHAQLSALQEWVFHALKSKLT